MLGTTRPGRSPRAVALALLVVLTAAAGAAAPGAGGASPAAQPGSAGFAVQDVDYDRFEFDTRVHANGSVRWTFRYARVLDNETERAEFESFAATFNGEETAAYRDFRTRARELTARAENTSTIDRPMDATGFRKSAFVSGVAADNLGVVEMSFVWTNGAATRADGRVVFGDVFAGGFYLGPNQTLTVSAGPGLALEERQPAPAGTAEDSVTYEGERTFGDERPRVVFSPAGTPAGDGAGGTTGDGTGSDGADGSDGGTGDGGLPASWLAVAVLALLGLGAAVAYRTGALDGSPGGAGAADADDGAGSAPDDGTAGASASVPEPTADADTDASTESAADAEPEPAVPAEELVSDEDRVISLIEERGGRMKQVTIVEETGWSKSKVSMLLSDMEEEGAISKLRIGRENVISLPGHEPDAAGSPFDDEE